MRQIAQHPLEPALVRREVLGQAAGVLVLDPGDVRLHHADALGQAVELALDEVEALLGGLHPGVDVALDEIVGQLLGHVHRDLRAVVVEDDLELVDHELAALSGFLRELGNHGLDADARTHEVDDLVAQHVLGLLQVQIQLVDDARQARAAQDLGRHQVQPLVEIAVLHARAHQILGHGLGLHQHGGVARVDVGQRHGEPVARQEDQQGGERGHLAAAAHEALEVSDLEAAFDVHGGGWSSPELDRFECVPDPEGRQVVLEVAEVAE